MPTPGQIDASRRGLAVLRSMRGAAGKLAQVADFIDPGWAPAEERAELELHLAELRDGAVEPLPFKRVERLLRDAWDGKLSDHLADLERDPAAMASAGQVHRGELDDGRAVAVKVIHPGLEEAVRADLGNLGLLLPIAESVLPDVDARAFLAEVRERALEEMDLENEAQSQRRFARGYRGHPFILIPAPVTDLARTDVLVSEWVDGVPFDEVLGLGDEVRDRYGEVLIRFHLGALSRADTFHADPHPGNHRLSGDGRVAFLDFGSTGSAAPPAWLSDLLIEAVTTPDAREPALDALVRRGRLPAGDLLAARMAVGLAAVLTWLRPNGDWSAMGRELKRAGNGATALGEAEAAFWAARGRRW